MKKYHFYVTLSFISGYMVCERGRGNHFRVSYPTKYRAQIVANALWRLWKNNSALLDYYKMRISEAADNWELTKSLCRCALVHVEALRCV